MRKTTLRIQEHVVSQSAFELTGFLERAHGLLGRCSLGVYEAYIFPHCKHVHSFGMKIPLELVYLDPNKKYLGYEKLFPGRLCHPPKNTEHIIELAEINAIRARIGHSQIVTW